MAPTAVDLEHPPDLTRIAASDEAHRAIGEHVYDFYVCQRCLRLITQPEMIAGLASREKDVRICPCGGLKFSPVGPNLGMRWYHWLLPRVLHFAYLRWRGRA